MRRGWVCLWFVCVLASARGASAASDIVVYASDVTTVSGNWALVSDASAAGGKKMSSGDSGVSTTAAPLANPTDFFDAPISAVGSTPYHVWVRLRATGNSKWNDSVWLQFNDAVSTS